MPQLSALQGWSARVFHIRSDLGSGIINHCNGALRWVAPSRLFKLQHVCIDVVQMYGWMMDGTRPHARGLPAGGFDFLHHMGMHGQQSETVCKSKEQE
jgi:hypothetical protein